MTQKESDSEQYFILTLQEITYSLHISPEILTEIIDEGIVNPQEDANAQLLFDHEAYRRINTVIKLHRDLGVNFAGAALIIELLDELQQLRLKS